MIWALDNILAWRGRVAAPRWVASQHPHAPPSTVSTRRSTAEGGVCGREGVRPALSPRLFARQSRMRQVQRPYGAARIADRASSPNRPSHENALRNHLKRAIRPVHLLLRHDKENQLMTRTKSIGLRERLTTLLPARTLWTLARESEFVVRARKLQPPEFLWTLVFGFAMGKERTIAGLRRAYATATRVRLVPSAFYDRFNGRLAAFLIAVVDLLIDEVSESAGPLSRGCRQDLSRPLVRGAAVQVAQIRFRPCRHAQLQQARRLGSGLRLDRGLAGQPRTPHGHEGAHESGRTARHRGTLDSPHARLGSSPPSRRRAAPAAGQAPGRHTRVCPLQRSAGSAQNARLPC